MSKRYVNGRYLVNYKDNGQFIESRHNNEDDAQKEALKLREAGFDPHIWREIVTIDLSEIQIQGLEIDV